VLFHLPPASLFIRYFVFPYAFSSFLYLSQYILRAFTSASVGVRSNVYYRTAYVCLSVCLSARISQKTTVKTVLNILHICYLWRQCDRVCTSGFVDDVMFSHNRTNVRESTRIRLV